MRHVESEVALSDRCQESEARGGWARIAMAATYIECEHKTIGGRIARGELARAEVPAVDLNELDRILTAPRRSAWW